MENSERLSTFHDAEFCRFSHNQELNSIELNFKKDDNQLVKIYFFRVVEFRLTDMILQNVVSRLLVHNINIKFKDSELRSRIYWISKNSEGEDILEPRKVRAYYDGIVSGK